MPHPHLIDTPGKSICGQPSPVNEVQRCSKLNTYFPFALGTSSAALTRGLATSCTADDPGLEYFQNLESISINDLRGLPPMIS